MIKMFLIKLLFVLWWISLLFSLKIEGLLVVFELEMRLWRRLYSGKFVYDGKEIEVDLFDGMFIILLCIIEFWWSWFIEIIDF